MELNQKYENLKNQIASYGRVVVAFSGGVDSSFLLKVCHDVLGDKVIAVTATSATYPEREFLGAQALCVQYGIKQMAVVSEELEIEGFSDNPPNRCYLCKKELFTKIWDIAKQHGISYVLEGSNVDDLGDYRPGMLAITELGVSSPLKDAALTKAEIRTLSKQLGLSTYNKPSFACLSSRFPYGTKITREKLKMIDLAEKYLLDLGFYQVRVRIHGDLARIEVGQDEVHKMFENGQNVQITQAFKGFGFAYVTVDTLGYRTGSMNEVLLQTL
ncbi:MAG: ATP-dependent sacrificial sulfur transferase LarE [Hyphomonadaceae bacterium]|nr:ATP-dependent sacrificial sulfur transferase LarE [Clostridia bacterium]